MRLRTLGLAWVLGAALASGVATMIWTRSDAAWSAHLARAYATGLALHGAVVHGAALPEAVTLHLLAAGDMPRAAPGMRVTQLSFLAPGVGPHGGGRLQVEVHSPDLQYPVAQIARDGGSGPEAGLANIIRLLAQFCSDPVVYLRADGRPWVRVEAPEVWLCASQPRDLRLWVALGLALVLAVILSNVVEVSAAFSGFATALAARRRPDGGAFPVAGPEELRQTVVAVNEALGEERARLERRALVLSGVSHDLGTPATRLRLRAALIDNPELRARFEADIDSMTGMIDSVLSYTRAEMGGEAPRLLSLTALVEAVVADWQDMGCPVVWEPPGAAEVASGGSVFGVGAGRHRLDEVRRVLVQGRPMALQRAVGNLIDNALKYGRRATVRLEASSTRAVIEVHDEGQGLSADQLARLTDPFARGPNAGLAPGAGLGLTIVSTIAAEHGGALEFEQRPGGLIARLVIARR